MTDLEKLKSWIDSWPGVENLLGYRIDYYDPKGDHSIGPAGLTELSRTEDIFGNVTVENQYCFGLHYIAEKDAVANAQRILDFQQWVQQQDLQHRTPTFGDLPLSERITAGSGALLTAAAEETATYLLQLTVNFKKFYEVN